MTCPYLAYLREGDNKSFDHERPFCGATESFVSPMQADLCNDRFDFHHTTHCSIYQEYERNTELETPIDRMVSPIDE